MGLETAGKLPDLGKMELLARVGYLLRKARSWASRKLAPMADHPLVGAVADVFRSPQELALRTPTFGSRWWWSSAASSDPDRMVLMAGAAALPTAVEDRMAVGTSDSILPDALDPAIATSGLHRGCARPPATVSADDHRVDDQGGASRRIQPEGAAAMAKRESQRSRQHTLMDARTSARGRAKLF
jgi:hypothetical protein